MPETKLNEEKRIEYFHSTPPLTVEQAKELIHEKMHLIDEEFKNGFDLVVKNPKSVTFFGSARFSEGNEYYEKARQLASKIVKETGYAIVSGGGPGIMEAANRGAKEADGVSVGYNIKLPREQMINPWITDTYEFHYFFVRKVMLTYSAETYIYFPGGFGTMDELFEILTLVETKKIPHVPIIMFGKEYWNPIIDLFRHVFLEKFETITNEDFNYFVVTDDMDEVVRIIKEAPLRKE
ncbi:MAG: TIGR00730 family Rossman fold protein [bacterium]